MQTDKIPDEIWINPIAETIVVNEHDTHGYFWCTKKLKLSDVKYIREGTIKKIIAIAIQCHDANVKSDTKIIDEVLANFKTDFNLETIVDLKRQIKELKDETMPE